MNIDGIQLVREMQFDSSMRNKIPLEAMVSNVYLSVSLSSQNTDDHNAFFVGLRNTV